MNLTADMSTYLRVYTALIALTILTVGASYIDLGAANSIVAITIAVAKAGLVVLFFMHVRESAPLIWVFAAGSIIWLALLISLTIGDVLSRDWIPPPQGW